MILLRCTDVGCRAEIVVHENRADMSATVLAGCEWHFRMVAVGN